MCEKPLDVLGGKKLSPNRKKSLMEADWNPLYHKYICVEKNGTVTCGGQSQKHQLPIGPGKKSNDSYVPDRCERVSGKNWCLENCLLNNFEYDRPNYALINNPFYGENCQEWADDTLAECQAACAGVDGTSEP